MEQNYKLFLNGEIIDFQKCFEQGYIEITPKGLKFSDKITVCRSSGLVDVNYNEIFEWDILLDTKGEKYLVEYYTGTFFISKIAQEQGCMPWALHGLKSGNRIDNMEVFGEKTNN